MQVFTRAGYLPAFFIFKNIIHKTSQKHLMNKEMNPDPGIEKSTAFIIVDLIEYVSTPVPGFPE